RRRIRINGAVDVLVKQVHVEMVKPSVFVLECKEWFPPQAVIDGETLSRSPRILYVGGHVLLAVVQVGLNVALRPGDGLTEQKIGQAKPPGDAPIEVHQHGCIDTRLVVDSRVHVVRSESELMRSSDPTYIFADVRIRPAE